MNNIVEHLRYRARADAQRLAIVDEGFTMTFGRLARIVAGAAARLRDCGIRPGQVAVTEIPQKAVDWILTLALIHEGVVTCSMGSDGSAAPAFRPDWRVVPLSSSGQDDARVIRVDRRWLEAAERSGGELAPAAFAPGSAFRLTLTSGTTGTPKASCQSVEGALQRVHSQLLHFAALPTWNVLPMRSIGGFNGPLTALMTGRPLFTVQSVEHIAALIRNGGIEAIYASPAQLASIAASLSDDRPATLKVVSFTGVEPGRSQLAQVEARLCREIVGFYGATEVGRVCMRRLSSDADMTDVGHPLPGCDVEIVDASGAAVASGEIGSIRIRSPFMVSGYFDDPASTAEAFRDGWFYPGDRGWLRADGSLVLAGRDREVINRDGVKIDPAAVDRFLREQDGISDAAAFGFAQENGVLGLGIALVCEHPVDDTRLSALLHTRFGRAGVPGAMLRVGSIPRNPTGKVDRLLLAARLERRRNTPL